MEFSCKRDRPGWTLKGFTFTCTDPRLKLPGYSVEYRSQGFQGASCLLVHRMGDKLGVVGRVDFHSTTAHRITFWAGNRATSAATAAAAKNGGAASGGLTVDLRKPPGSSFTDLALPLPAVKAMVVGSGPQQPTAQQLLSQLYRWKRVTAWTKENLEMYASSASARNEKAMAIFKPNWPWGAASTAR